MLAVHQKSTPTIAAERPALPIRAAQFLSGLLRAWHNRRAFNRLADMSDYELADIGLTRTDLQVGWRLDPTAEFAPLARARTEAATRAANRAPR